MANLAKLVVQLEAQTAKYQRELEKANRKLSRFERTQRRGINLITGGFKALAGAVAAVSFGRVIRQTIDLGDQFAKVSDRLGISVEAISNLSFAAERSGVSVRAMELGLQRLQRRVAEAAVGMGEAQGALVELGIDARKLAALPLEQQFAAVADAIQQVEGDSNKTRLAFKLFDSEGVALLQTIKDGSAGLEDYAQQARDLGFTMSEEMASQFAEAKDAMTDLDSAVQGIANTFVVALTPAIVAVSDALTDLVNTTLQERRDQLEEEIRQLRSDIAANVAGGREFGADPAAIERQKLKLAGLEFELELTETRLEKEKQVTAEQEKQLTVFEKVKSAATGGAGTDLFPELTIESNRDRILRPEVREDIELTERSFSLLGESVKEVKKDTVDLGLTFQSAFEDAIIEGNNLRDVMKGLLDDIIRILIRTTITSPLGDFFGGIFGGGKADGGPVRGGTAYVVGERGPELFVPQSSGTIVPNGAGGNVVNVTSNLNIGGGGDLSVATLIPILEQNNRKVKSEMLEAFDRGTFA